ncbi:MAG: thioredoxin domain-containing protein, partial [Alphaproteobacteria bacterium]
EGEEGKFYVWSEAEIDRALGDDGAAFKGVYDVTGKGNWEGKTILNRSKSGAFDEDGVLEATLTRCREKLLAIRDGRVRPGWDDKVLADWNGLMIAALANAGAVFGNDRWTNAARDAFAFVAGNMSVDDRLYHSYRLGKPQHMATVDDYAHICAAALALHEATAEVEYLHQCEGWAAVADRHYWDGNGEGYFYTADDAEDLITRTKSCTENATPGGNGVMAKVLARLYLLTGKDTYRDRCDGIFRAFSGELGRNAFPLATLINAYEFRDRAAQIVIIGERGDGTVQAFVDAVHGLSLPDRVIMVIEPGTALPQSHPAAGKTGTAGVATAYVCFGQTCSLPVTDPDALIRQLSRRQ